MAGEHQKEERGKIPVLQVLRRELIGGKAELKRKALRSQQAGTGVKAPGQPSLLNEGLQQNVGDGCVHADGNSKLRGTFFHRAIIGMNPEKNTSQVTASEEVVVMPMRWQQGKVSKLNHVEKKQFNPDGWWGDVLHVNILYTTMLLPAGQCCRTLFFCLLFSFFSWFVVILRVIKILLIRDYNFHERRG